MEPNSNTTVMFLPPAILLDDCKLPSRDGVRTVGDMARIIIADESAINEHNANMQALREYRVKLLKSRQSHVFAN